MECLRKGLLAAVRRGQKCHVLPNVLCGPPPSGELADQDRVDLSGLCKIEQSVARGAINVGPGGRIFEDADHVVTATFRERCQFGDLSLARLVRGRNPRINCGALSQLNPPDLDLASY